MPKVGEIVEYLMDWKPNRKFQVLSLDSNGLCRIVLIRDGSIYHGPNNDCLNYNIVILPIKLIKVC